MPNRDPAQRWWRRPRARRTIRLLAGIVLVLVAGLDAGLKQLSRVRYLAELNLAKTGVTDAGVAAFLKVHPFVHIIR